MKIIGFNYTKVSAERILKWEPLKKINTNIAFTNIEKDEVDVMKDSDVLRVSFKFEVEYETKNATILMEGIVLINADKEFVKEAMKKWSKKKEVSTEVRDALIKLVWKKCNLRAFQLEEELNIPTHIQLPQIKIEQPTN